MKILYIGDVMAEAGIAAVERILPSLISEERIDFVVAQAENVSDGKGMSADDMHRLQAAGVGAFSGGNHTPHLSELTPLLEDTAQPVIGPANMADCPGQGYKLVQTERGAILVMSLLGSIVGKQSDTEMTNPLKKIDEILATVPRDAYIVSVANLHGDYSSEKKVFGHYLDGRVSIAVGDHWHIPTADAEVLARGTAYITDVGMCGSLDSSLGVSFDSIVPRWRDGYQTRNQLETAGRQQFCALLTEVNDQSGRAEHVQHIRRVWEP